MEEAMSKVYSVLDNLWFRRKNKSYKYGTLQGGNIFYMEGVAGRCDPGPQGTGAAVTHGHPPHTSVLSSQVRPNEIPRKMGSPGVCHC